MSLDVEKLWAQFIDAQGDEVEAWVATEFRKSSGQFEYADGTHAMCLGNAGSLRLDALPAARGEDELRRSAEEVCGDGVVAGDELCDDYNFNRKSVLSN